MTGLFETMLVVRGSIVQREEHFARLAASAHALRFPPPREQEFHAAVADAVREVQSLEEAALRCHYGHDGDAWRLTATTGPIPPVTLDRRNGARAITLGTSRSLPEHKTMPYTVSADGLQRAVEAGANEGFFLDERGRVLEGTATNVFACHDSQLITAPVRDGILPGVVRAWVIEHGGLDVIERAPTIEELLRGGFVTSSLTMIAPLASIDGRVGNELGREFTALQTLWSTSVCHRPRTP